MHAQAPPPLPAAASCTARLRRQRCARAPLHVVAVRNRGRLRDPYDTPLRDGNRDRRAWGGVRAQEGAGVRLRRARSRLFGLLTQRAAATLLVYSTETNQVQGQWLNAFLHAVRTAPARRSRRSSLAKTHGENARRKLPRAPLTLCALICPSRILFRARGSGRRSAATTFCASCSAWCAVTQRRTSATLRAHLRPSTRRQGLQTIANPYTGDTLTIDPRSLAQRILEARARRATRANVEGLCNRHSLACSACRARTQIRKHLAIEFVEDLKWVKARYARTPFGVPVLVAPGRLTPFRSCACVRACGGAQEENADMLRESLSCALKLPDDNNPDIDDDGRPIKRAA